MSRQVRIVLPQARCNLRCKYCVNGGDIWDWNGYEPEKFLDKLAKINFTTIGIWGGEPLANPWLEVVLKMLREHYPDVEIYILSNGTLLDEHFVQMFNELDVSYSISYDGKMQYLRCKDFMQSPAYIKELQKLKHFAGFNCVVSRNNCDMVDAYNYICKVAKDIKGDWEVSYEMFELSMPETIEYMPSVEQYQTLFKSYKEIVRLAENGAPHLKNIARSRNSAKEIPNLWRCGAEARITLDCQGRSYFCQVMADKGDTTFPNKVIPMMCAECKHVAKCRGICPNIPDYLRKKMCMIYHLYYDALESLGKEEVEYAPF